MKALGSLTCNMAMVSNGGWDQAVFSVVSSLTALEMVSVFGSTITKNLKVNGRIT